MARGRGLTDWALFAFAVGLGTLAQEALRRDHGVGLDAVDIAVGTIACLALWARRSHPVAVALAAVVPAALSPAATGAALVAWCSAALWARGRGLAAVIVAAAAASVAFPLVNPKTGEMLRIGFPAFLVSLLAFGWGLYLRTRRELVASLRERADRLQADQARSVEAAREAERRRIAREMHDVLAHRLSLLSLHAGALEFRPDAPAADIASAAAVIRTSAAAALGDLRQVITVLREDAEDGTRAPQPGFGELDDLLAESRQAGMAIEARIDLSDAVSLPGAAGRTAYRVVQEGLTNARKHAPGAPVEVVVAADGCLADGQAAVVAEVISYRPAGELAAVPGSGAGLIGLAERLELAGGQLEHGPTLAGGFVLRATIPAVP